MQSLSRSANIHRSFSLLFYLSLLVTLSEASKCSWENCNEWKNDKDWINVHLICHTHDDLGWLKTVDQYYTGVEKLITPAGVQYVVNTVVEELYKNPRRRFSWAETGFLWRWINDHHDAEKHRFEGLVKNGQIEFIGGGWVQHDEAVTHYIDIIDQMTYGLRKLNESYGRCGVPRIAWQIDPFGHSRESGNLFAAMGYEALYFSRLHYLEKAWRLNQKQLEFLWNTSDDMKTHILTGTFYADNYGPPPGFCFDQFCSDDPIVDNKLFSDYNIGKKVSDLIWYIHEQARHSQTNHIMLLMGGDFHYTNADSWFTNLDKLIGAMEAMENQTKIRIFYSTPSCYMDAVVKAGPRLKIRNGDFFPYASNVHEYWTGFYSSRPSLKGSIRQSSAFLQVAKQFDVFANLGPEDEGDLNVFRAVEALLQHHDAVTGTERQRVVFDYRERLSKGWHEGEQVLNDAFKKLLPKKGVALSVPQQKLCPLLNETVCKPMRVSNIMAISALNGNTQAISTILRVPLYNSSANVLDWNGKPLDAQIMKPFYGPLVVEKRRRAPYELIVPVTIQPMGLITFFVERNPKRAAQGFVKYYAEKEKQNTRTSGTVGEGTTRAPQSVMTNGIIELHFDKSGHMSMMKNLLNGKEISLRQEFFFYASTYERFMKPSGAYMFRPDSSVPIAFNNSVTLRTVNGPFVNETWQAVSPWISQVIRLYKNKSYVEVEWTVGPVLKEHARPVAKEVITRYTTDISSNGTFFTDSNGRQILMRRVNHSDSFNFTFAEPVAANYYPVNSRIFIKDDQTQFTVLTDRSEGGTSLRDGEVELLLHRRSFSDDGFGLNEGLDEPGNSGKGLIARGRHWLLLDDPRKSAQLHRSLAMQLFYSPLLMFASLNITPELYIKSFATNCSGLTRKLPDNVHILTLEQWKGHSILLRIEHLYQGNEDPQLSQPVSVDLKGLFTAFEIISLREVALGANRGVIYKSQSLRKQRLQANMIVSVKPMEIRTFEMDVRYHETYVFSGESK